MLEDWTEGVHYSPEHPVHFSTTCHNCMYSECFLHLISSMMVATHSSHFKLFGWADEGCWGGGSLWPTSVSFDGLPSSVSSSMWLRSLHGHQNIYNRKFSQFMYFLSATPTCIHTMTGRVEALYRSSKTISCTQLVSSYKQWRFWIYQFTLFIMTCWHNQHLKLS